GVSAHAAVKTDSAAATIALVGSRVLTRVIHFVQTDGDAGKPFRTAERCRFGRDSLLWIGVNDRRSLAMTARACPQGIPEFLAALNQGRRDLSHRRQARRATKGQASWTERLFGGPLEDDCHLLR